jgi:hypothetical protein
VISKAAKIAKIIKPYWFWLFMIPLISTLSLGTVSLFEFKSLIKNVVYLILGISIVWSLLLLLFTAQFAGPEEFSFSSLLLKHIGRDNLAGKAIETYRVVTDNIASVITIAFVLYFGITIPVEIYAYIFK